MRIFFAGAKPETKAHPWDDPRVAAGHELDVMTTFWEMKEKKLGKRKRRFLRGLKQRRTKQRKGK